MGGKNLRKFLNPLHWVDLFFSFIGRIFSLICSVMGWGKPQADGFQNIRPEDVEREAQTAKEQQDAVEELVKRRSPGSVVHAYACADSATRSSIDLSVLDVAQQDWLMRLSDAELILLSGSGESACTRSVNAMQVIPNFKKLRAQPEELAAKILPIPTKASAVVMTEDEKFDTIRAQYNALFRTLAEPRMKPRTA
jgi:hypothetical protein